MTLKIDKPESKSVDDFIKGGKADRSEEDVPAGEKKDKTFLLRIPYGLWDQARRKAGAQATSLHDWIIEAIREKVERG